MKSSISRRMCPAHSVLAFLAGFLAIISIFDSPLLAQAAPALSNRRADFLLLKKSERRLTLFSGGQPLREYRVALGPAPTGAKERQGDGRTPEGRYFIDRRNPRSRFYKSLHISYPESRDVRRARAQGVSPGGDIFIHGLGSRFGWIGSRHRLRDWTLGCIAVTNEEIDEIWQLVPDRTPIEIQP